MAEAQAHTTASPTPGIRNLLINCEYITLEAFGKRGNTVVYHIIAGNQDTPASPKHVACIIEVVEGTQDICVKLNDNGPALLVAKYGIGALQDIMYMFDPNTAIQLAELTNKNAIDHINRYNKLRFIYAPNFPIGKCTVRSSGKQYNNFVASLYQRGRSAYAEITGSGVSDMQKVLTMMTMLKLYYCAYLLHLTVKPAGILSGIQPIIPFIPSVHYLGPMSSVVLRVASRTPTVCITEVCDATTHNILLIIELQSNLTDDTSKMFIRDPLGTICFTSEIAGNTSSVYTATGTLLGSYYRTYNPDTVLFFDTHTGTPIMTERAQPQANHYQVTSASENHAVVAQYIPLAPAAQLGVTMTQTIPVEHKALILTSACHKA